MYLLLTPYQLKQPCSESQSCQSNEHAVLVYKGLVEFQALPRVSWNGMTTLSRREDLMNF